MPISKIIQKRMMPIFLAVMLIFMAFPMTAAAKNSDLKPADGLRVYVMNNSEEILVKEYTLEQAEQLCGETQFYSSIDSYPAGVLTAAKGINLEEYSKKIMTELNIGHEKILSIGMRSTDRMPAYYQSTEGYFYPELFNEKYYGVDGDQNKIKNYTSDEAKSIIDSKSQPLKPVLAVRSYQGRIGDLKADYKKENLSQTEPVTLDQLKEFTASKMDHSSSSRFCSVQTDNDVLTQNSTTSKVVKGIYKVTITLKPGVEFTGQKLENPNIITKDIDGNKVEISVAHKVEGVKIRYDVNDGNDPVELYDKPIVVDKPKNGSVDYHFVASKIGYVDSDAVLAQVTNQPQVSLTEVTTFSELQQAVANSTPGQIIKIKKTFSCGDMQHLGTLNIKEKEVILEADSADGKDVKLYGIKIDGNGTLTVKSGVILVTDTLVNHQTNYYTNDCKIIFEGDLGNNTSIGADNSTIIVNGNIKYTNANQRIELINGSDFTLNGNIEGVAASRLVSSWSAEDKVLITGNVSNSSERPHALIPAVLVVGTLQIDGNITSNGAGIEMRQGGDATINGNIKSGLGYTAKNEGGPLTVKGDVLSEDPSGKFAAVYISGNEKNTQTTVLGNITANATNGIGALAMNTETNNGVLKYAGSITAKYPTVTEKNLTETGITLPQGCTIGTYTKIHTGGGGSGSGSSGSVITNPPSTIEKKTDSTGTVTVNNTELQKAQTLKVTGNASADHATLQFDSKAVGAIAAAGKGDVKISTTKIESSALSNEQKAQLKNLTKGDMSQQPIYAFKVTVGDKSVSDFGGGKVSITVDYKPKSGEDTDHIVIYHLKDDGSIDVIKDCKYDAKTGKLSFAASSFSYFMLGHESQMKKTFQDVPTHVWYYDSVSYLIEKNLIKGKTATSFAPESNITRAEFVQILYNMAGKSAQESKDPGTIYRDVAANAWYYNAVAWGTKVGVVTGEGNLFRPTDKVSRQEMAVMLDRYVKNVAKVSLKETKGQLTFMDAQAIGQWARPSVTIMQKAGVINGIEKGAGTFNFAPTDRATRAQAAQMISALVKQLS